MHYDELANILGFTPDDRRTFLYVDDFCRRLEAWLQHHELHKEQLDRLALVYLFIDYRAAKSAQEEFTTLPTMTSRSIPKRYEFFNRHYNPIQSTSDYFSRLSEKGTGMKDKYKDLGLAGISRHLISRYLLGVMYKGLGGRFFDYVIYG